MSCSKRPSAGHRRRVRGRDEVYGGRELRRAIRSCGMGYVLAVRANTTVGLGAALTTTVASAVKLIPDRAWQRLRTGSGAKGARHYDWAMLEITADDTPDDQDDGNSMLLIRRHRYTRTVSFYRCWTPKPGDAITSTEPGRPTSAGILTPMRHCDHELQLPHLTE
jgi:hypothetical protein